MKKKGEKMIDPTHWEEWENPDIKHKQNPCMAKFKLKAW